MALSEKDKKLLLLLGILGILSLTYFLVYSPYKKKQEALNQEIKKLETDYNVLLQKQASKAKYETDLKAVRYQLQKNEALLPPDLPQEYILHSLKEMEEAAGVRLGDLAFSEMAVIGQPSGTKNPVQPDTNNTNATNSLPVVPQQQSAKQPVNGMGIKLDVKTTYNGTYPQVKRLMEYVSSFENKVVISDINFRSGENGNLTGNLALTFYGYQDTTRTMPEWKHEVESGREDIFAPFSGYIAATTGAPGSGTVGGTANSGGAAQRVKYDFILIASPYSADIPSAILGYAQDTSDKSYVYEDSREYTDVEIQFIQENNQIYYKYKVGKMSYPVNYEKEKMVFTPYGEEINLHVVSTKRNGDKDRNGVNLSIVNKTNRNVSVKIDYEDEKDPRVKLTQQEGRITVIR